MKRKRDNPVYMFCRRGNSLVPSMAYDLAALEPVAQGEEVQVLIQQKRSRPRLRLYWATLRDCVEATECAPSPEALHMLLKMECGLTDFIKLPDGTVIKVPGSIALDSLEEPEMIRFFQAAEKYLAETFGFSRELAA